ncbi:recombinase family protein [Bacteroides thetaiotaomicron]|uniref:recombinase family protein n=1 Tax=Bacteroides thetaiotaomicron TaxID=818 RepID=UPI00286D6D32|nr:recombinase family protein [Bacteroides thetaiotaomicron]MCS3009496.1 recombinase family protein [Bacteroides thetaiotaomicron]
MKLNYLQKRSISGKISALKNRGINIGGFCNYGYTTDKVSKKMIIDKDEAKVVKRIFEMYNEGKSQHEICDILNDLGTPAPYFTRLNNANRRRKEKGFKEKDYNGKDNSIWIISSLNRILKNEIYIGKRFFEFYKPNVDKYVDKEIDDLFKIVENKKEDIEIKREILERFEISDKDLSIVSDDLFNSIQNKLILNRTNKNPELKHKNLLKSKLVCGVCGSNWAVGKQNNYQIYRCYGTYKGSVSRKKICFDSLQIMQSKLNGLIVRLSIHRFAEMQVENNSQSKIDNLKKKISDSNNLIFIKEKELFSIKNNWLNWFNKAIKFNIDDDIIMDKKKEYDMESISIIKQIDRYKKM